MGVNATLRRRCGPAVARRPASAWARGLTLLGLCVALGCAHDVIWLGDEPPPYIPPEQPIGFTVAFGVQSFEAKRLLEPGFVDRFATALREAELFAGVIHPIPPGFEPMWELKLLVRDELYDPDINFWKSAFASLAFPFRFLVHMEEDYTVYVEALITRRGEVVGSYSAKAPVRHRFQTYSPQKELEAAELIIQRASAQVLAEIAADAARLDALDRARAGR